MRLDATIHAPGDAGLLKLTEEVLSEYPEACIDPMPFSPDWIDHIHKDYFAEHQPEGRLERLLVHEIAHGEICLAQLRAITVVVHCLTVDKHLDKAPPHYQDVASVQQHPEHVIVRAAIARVYEKDLIRNLERSRALFLRMILSASAELRRLQKARLGKPLAVKAADRPAEQPPAAEPAPVAQPTPIRLQPRSSVAKPPAKRPVPRRATHPVSRAP